MPDEWTEDRSFLIDFGRNPDGASAQGGLIFRRGEVEELYSFRFDFKEGEAKTYAELLKQVDKETIDYDDTIFVQKIEPPLTERLKPSFAFVFLLALIWFFKFLIFGK